MKRFTIVILLIGSVVPASAQRSNLTGVVLATRLLADGTRSFLAEVREPAGQPVDEVRFELPSGASNTAVSMMAPKGWTLERDGRSIRLSGEAVTPPFRLRVALFDVKTLERVPSRVRSRNKNIFDESLDVAPLPNLTAMVSPAGLVFLPSVVHPGETIELGVVDVKQTPPDGQWFISGVQATPVATNRLSVKLPDDLSAGSGLRVSYFDVWGQRVFEALAAQDIEVRERQGSVSSAPKIAGCAKYGFLGQSICVCGEFPESSRTGLLIDGQPAQVAAASENVIHLLLPETITTGPHVISGNPAMGFGAGDTASTRVIALRASLDSSALLRGQSTVMRLAIAGAIEPLTLAVTNRTPQTISIPGGNYQEIRTSGDENVPVERPVNARLAGDFKIDSFLPELPCPCMKERSPEYVSTASQPTPIVVPRRVLATIAAGTPAAMTATAQAVAAANGLSLVEVTPLVLGNQGLAVFEILDGIGAIAKAAALTADPRVTLAQADFVYDVGQSTGPSGPSLAYGPGMIGADVARTVSRGDGVRVALIDAGVDNGNARLEKRVAEFSDVTGTGWTPDVHGTLVAGVITAETGPDGAEGIAPGATLVAVKSCVALSATQAAARCWSSTLARGIDIAAGKNVRLINLSVGGPQDRLLTRMVNEATTKGITVVAAAGNDGPGGKPSFPAVLENVIAVTAVDAAAHLYSRATRGSFIDLAAPGVEIASLGPGGRTQLFSGTSAATAFTSGAVALLLQRSNLKPDQLRTLLQSTAKDLGSGGKDDEFGDGLIDVCRAIAKALSRQVPCR